MNDRESSKLDERKIIEETMFQKDKENIFNWIFSKERNTGEKLIKLNKSWQNERCSFRFVEWSKEMLFSYFEELPLTEFSQT